MHSTFVRIQNVFGLFTSVAFAVAAAIAFSVVLSPQSPKAKLELRNVQVVKGRPHYYSTKREEYANVRFDLDADLSTLFNWNTKQIFLYITASYPSPSSTSDTTTAPDSEAIIWDAIIPSLSAPWHQNTYIHPTSKPPTSQKKRTALKSLSSAFPAGTQPGIVRLKDQKPKYQITDTCGKIAEVGNATLTLKWNVQPWVGALVWSNKVKVGRWEGLKGGVSKTFGFPMVKGTEVKKEDVGTAVGGERNRGSPA
ncbi:hypothetical protein B0A48_00773 [Cryoendolithus antarcticus]|uniref:Signal peptidase subunit 3 n=1 Tax=Cryoendolithus antarcticus TaxID=1507870 RepID=A0A1V8TRG0_9PEZI|nr:hypothetical protein B0A48_00773 [Cryoendolithus antarcticus]